ncbi:sodium/proton antiporter 1 isoform X2 [Cryptomeria japonica]|uniref:sodium/proton antiporter 1 isoform X2 n=1 Tax=Cryptomeria japonica TaxID=3369 RepID=UPI0027DA4B86|nr:sodium/proton antiporter 1 isoform X2 [Cryptomeria japonica]
MEGSSISKTCDPLCSVDERGSDSFKENYKQKTDLWKALTILAFVTAGAAVTNHSWVASHQDLAMASVFTLGYAGIIIEESLAFNKSSVALLMAVTLWVIRSIGAPSVDVAVHELSETSAEVSQIVFFLLGAMTIVEIVDAHKGFKLVTDNITTRKPQLLLWVVAIITFFLSAVLDNLTTTIVMISLLRKLVPDCNFRKLMGGVVVLAANSGGAWTPLGDVTTTMLWIDGHISSSRTIQDLFLPSAISLVVPLALISLSGAIEEREEEVSYSISSEQMAPRGQLVFGVGIASLLFVPIFKAVTGLPPYMGMLFGLGVLWILTDAIHYGDSRCQRLKVPQALSRIDSQGILFFLGILLSVGSLEAAGILKDLANYLDSHISSVELVASVIGIVSAVIDNVPLVAATMGMYDISSFPKDAELWQLIALCAGTGGSILIIGSAAGVAFMGMEKVDFLWYLKKVSGFAFAGYAAGIAAYLAAHHFHDSLSTITAQLPLFSSS